MSTSKPSINEDLSSFNTNDFPQIKSLTKNSPGSVSLSLFVGEDVSWFEGHFPDNPVLPGVVQTHWASEFGCKLFSPEGESLLLGNIKFSSMLLPNTACSLHLDFDSELNRIVFKYEQGETIYSQGRIKFK